MRLCSACLLGVKCRYDGKAKKNDKVVSLLDKEVLIPICPEQLGGLATPRAPSEIDKQGKVVTNDGENLSNEFESGAKEVLRIAKLYGINEAILKEKSPSCGSKFIYDGTFSGKLIKGSGITTKLLRENGIKVVSEEDL